MRIMGYSDIDGLDISPLLSCMICGATHINLTKDNNLYQQLDYFTPLFFHYSLSYQG